MRYFFEMKVLPPYDGVHFSIEMLKEFAKQQLANKVAEEVLKEAKTKMNFEGTCILATWDTKDGYDDWEVLEWPTP